MTESSADRALKFIHELVDIYGGTYPNQLVPGLPTEPASCPISNTIVAYVENVCKSSTTKDTVKVTFCNGEALNLYVPDEIADFVREFDREKIPELIQKEYKLRIERLDFALTKLYATGMTPYCSERALMYVNGIKSITHRAHLDAIQKGGS